MQPLRAVRATGGPDAARDPASRPRRGPGPSKLAYRLQRAWKKPWVRSLVTVYLPLAILGALGWRAAAEDRLRLAVEAEVRAMIDAFAARREFAIQGVVVSGGNGELRAQVRRAIGPQAGTSSLTLDFAALRDRLEAIGAVARAEIRFDTAGKLQVALVPRVPAALWRAPAGDLHLVDAHGAEIALVAHRARHPDLPLLLGAGARDHVPEALRLVAVAPALRSRLRGIARVGERRWDVVLDKGLVIKLPATGAADALAGAMALHYGEELLDRDLAVIDLRVPGRPTLRLTPEAIERQILDRAQAAADQEET